MAEKDNKWLQDLHRRREQVLARLNSENRKLDLIRLSKIEELLRIEDPKWISPPHRFSHLKAGDAAIILLIEFGGSAPYGILVERLIAEGVNFGNHKRIGDIKKAINYYVDQKKWFDCTSPTDGDEAELDKALVSLSKAFERYCSDNAARAKKWGIKGE